jgi:hypothetical protein
MGKQFEISAETVELTATDGVAFIEQASPLTRLHYFDGKALRADAFALEQDYHRTRTRLGNIAGGWGAVNGLGFSLSGNELDVSAGLAITAAGNFVLATGEMHANLADLLSVAAPPPPDGSANFADCMEKAKPGVKETAGLAIYEITIGPVEGLCGNEPVYGKLCESACASDSRHPYWREGVVLRLRPVSLQLPTSTSVPAAVTHLRNRVASAYFRAEPWLTPSALSASGLASGVWCQPATLYGRDEVVIGLLAREGGVNRVIDAWSGRRERMDTQARGYWQGRMAMRPWNVFVAQILQFQCQLSGLFEPGTTVIQPGDDCDKLRKVLDKTREELDGLIKRYGQSTKKILFKMERKPTAKEMQFVANDMASSFADLDGLSAKLADLESGQGALPKQRMLLNAGFFELPPAGYLPLNPQASVEEQMERMFGEGVHLHYHAVRHDEIAHLVEEAQHLDRISLTRGLDNVKDIEQVEIFVPDGEVRGAAAVSTGTWWRLQMLSTAVQALFSVGPPIKTTGAPPASTAPSAQPAPPGAAPAPKSATAASKKRADAKAATSDATATATAGAPAAEMQRANSALTLQRLRLSFDGIVRTEGREDGSSGFALVASTDPLDNQGQLTQKDPNGADATGNIPGPVMSGDRQTNATSERRMGIYLSGDIAKDPFGLPVGGAASVKAEVRTMAGIQGLEIQVGGTLTVLAQRALPNGREERLVQLDLQLTESSLATAAQASATRMRLLLQRDGDSATGIFIIDDEKHDQANSPVIFEWDDTPRHAAMFVEADDASQVIKRLSQMRARGAISDLDRIQSLSKISGQGASLYELATATRQRLLDMSGLPAMPEPTSTVGVAAINTLVQLADVTDDAAFLLRSRQRLFPTIDAPKTQTVRAIHDWLMFRRARTHLCAPECQATTSVGIEAFQVWHLVVDNEDQLKKLTTALDNGDDKTLAAFAFKRVGLLRYRDESAYSEEPAERVLQMWTDAKPAAQVVLGRVWETAPTAGQGWQNHFRLRNMIEQISSLTKPPVRADGALAAIPLPSSKLADGSLDGGMLVVTTGVAAATRNALLLYGNYDSPNHFFNDTAPRTPLQFIGDVPQGDVLLNFVKGLTAEQPVRGISLAITAATPPDAGAGTRLKSAVKAVVDVGRPEPVPGRQKLVNLNAHDHAQLVAIGVKPEDFDEIIFFELNAGQ